MNEKQEFPGKRKLPTGSYLEIPKPYFSISSFADAVCERNLTGDWRLDEQRKAGAGTRAARMLEDVLYRVVKKDLDYQRIINYLVASNVKRTEIQLWKCVTDGRTDGWKDNRTRNVYDNHIFTSSTNCKQIWTDGCALFRVRVSRFRLKCQKQGAYISENINIRYINRITKNWFYPIFFFINKTIFLKKYFSNIILATLNFKSFSCLNYLSNHHNSFTKQFE